MPSYMVMLRKTIITEYVTTMVVYSPSEYSAVRSAVAQHNDMLWIKLAETVTEEKSSVIAMESVSR